MLDYLSSYLSGFNLRWKHLSAYYYRLSKLEGGSSRGNPARELLDEYGCGNKYAHEKEIPETVHRWDNESVAQLIAGLIDTDGTVFLRRSRGKEALGFGFCSTSRQMELCLKMIRKPVVDTARFERVLERHIYALRGAYSMND